jgi:hypothetical protein
LRWVFSWFAPNGVRHAADYHVRNIIGEKDIGKINKGLFPEQAFYIPSPPSFKSLDLPCFKTWLLN